LFLLCSNPAMLPNRLPRAGDAAPFELDFDPVPVRARKDGWTPARQAAFIAALRETRCVLEACRRVGLSSESAYRLYRRADAASFRRAWHAAFARAEPPRPSTSGAPSTSPPAPPPRAPFTAVALWPVPKSAPPPASCISSTSSTSPTSATTNGMCQKRQLHQLPRDHQLPDAAPPRGRPAYSAEAFARAARAAVKARAR
jgi:hypothetical protein